jgi:O-antigen chain-terminating methyltransferase
MQPPIESTGLKGHAPKAPKISLHVDDVQRLMGLLHDLDEPERAKEALPESDSNTARHQLAFIPMPVASRKDVYRTLLTRGDEQFIRSAYLLLLGRLPDEGGRNSSLDLLQRQRMARADFLSSILSSKEASLKCSRMALSKSEIRITRVLERLLRTFLSFFFRRTPSVHGTSLSANDQFSDSIATLTRKSSLLAKAVGHLNELFRTLQRSHEKATNELRYLNQTAVELREHIRALQSLRDELTSSVEQQRKQQQQFERSLKEQENRQTFIERKILAIGAAPSQVPSGHGGSEAPLGALEVGAPAAQNGTDVARYYFEFENAFRGEESAIKDRVRYYLDVIDTQLGPVLDLGCGRGEWLEVLKESNIKSYGIDSNETSFMRCIGKGLDVQLGDALNHLRSLADNSLGAISALHVVEHMPWEVVLDLIKEAHRVLIPGGTLILETPNPENVLVGSCYFYHDPTHRNPIVPSVLNFTVKYFGFESVETLRFRPTEFLDTIDAQEWAKPLLRAFNAPQDFAVVGRKG